ncbi:hypothetical protein DUZ99_13995 [Xylanibacillus composti]|uniref:PilZ domain-containing protein n=1 Tax=Xylanibacillus composti TaxID=1572762 RepID=A0A8J4H594_9BACL|nr:PilZ domain-containing protein [Xylanibacillus composti]MDT9726090.1 hypothetical protein [Xylanibacillus composti]GIQ68763.1 hypothetical protein XYCOK13_15870 [Xylanibacillus composti]
MDDAEHLEFWPGQWIELQNESGDIFHTQIMKSEGRLTYIQRPTNRYCEHMSMTPGQSVEVFFHDQRNGLYSFTATLQRVQGRDSFESPFMRNVKRAQRRKYFRVPVDMEMELVEKSDDPAKSRQPLLLRTADLGGGGVAFHCAQSIPAGSKTSGVLHLRTKQNSKQIPFHGTIMNCRPLPDGQYKIALEFEDMKESLRSEIIKFCMFKQIELRNKLKNYSV